VPGDDTGAVTVLHKEINIKLIAHKNILNEISLKSIIFKQLSFRNGHYKDSPHTTVIPDWVT
jgi:hypothetical protein